MAEIEKQKGKEQGLKDFGIIYISGAIDGGTSESVCKDIIEYNIRAEVNQIQMVINSPGGSCPAGFSIIDIMEWSRIPIYTTGIGIIASMALLVFMTGEKGRRVITPRTSILSHRFSAFSVGSHSQLIAGRKAEDLEHERILQHYLAYSNIKDTAELEKYLLRDVDTWLTPEEAIQHGIADRIEPVRKRGAA
jgi:ATP-dependent Clp protease protease subunit